MHSWIKLILAVINENEKIKTNKKINAIWTETQQILNIEV